MFDNGRRYLGFKKEESPYTAPQTDMVQADFDLLVENIKYSANIEKTVLAYASGDTSAFPAVMGKQDVSVSFSIPITQGASASTAPKWSKVAECCGFGKTIHGTTGISWKLDVACNAIPAYIEVHEVSDDATAIPLVIQIRGAMGNMKIIGDGTGKPGRLDFEFKGVLQGIEDRASITPPAGYDTVQPAPIMNTTITAYGEALDCDKITIDCKNKVELYNDPSTGLNGYTGARIARDQSDPPTLQVDPYLASVANRAYYSKWTNATTGAFLLNIGTLLHISMPAIQLVKAYDGGNRNSRVINTLDFTLNRGSSGNDELEILQGAKA